MKDDLLFIGLILVLVLIVASNIVQNHRIENLEDEVQSMNEQIVYIEGEIEIE